MVKPVQVKPLALKKRTAFLDRADAVRRLQQIGRHREASLLRANIMNEIGRLRGDLRVADPYMNHMIKGEIEKLVGQLRAVPHSAGHWGALRR
jgi:hypothetical protein